VAEPVKHARKVPGNKALRVRNMREEIGLIKNFPKSQRLIVIAKVSAVVLLAIALEGIATQNWPQFVVFAILTLIVGIYPMKVKVQICPRCGSELLRGAAICKVCGVPTL